MATGYCFGAPFVMDVGGTDDIVAGALAMTVIVYPSVKYIHKLFRGLRPSRIAD
jgi:dienelactone hydrolase